MLRAITAGQNVEQNRLWFNDHQHDLFVWLDDSKNPIGFQFSYNKNLNEQLISWSKGRGFSHDKVDSGEPGDGSYKMTPIMVPDGQFDNRKVAAQFRAISADIDNKLSNFIYQTLLRYPQP